MNKRVKKNWIKALRSDDYQQGTCALRHREVDSKKDSFCCLGVLYDIEFDGDWTEVRSPYTKGYSWYTIEPTLEASQLSIKFRDKLKITDEQEADLMALNDSGYSFNEIADWIDRNM
jgi:hypothetical protein